MPGDMVTVASQMISKSDSSGGPSCRLQHPALPAAGNVTTDQRVQVLDGPSCRLPCRLIGGSCSIRNTCGSQPCWSFSRPLCCKITAVQAAQRNSIKDKDERTAHIMSRQLACVYLYAIIDS